MNYNCKFKTLQSKTNIEENNLLFTVFEVQYLVIRYSFI